MNNKVYNTDGTIAFIIHDKTLNDGSVQRYAYYPELNKTNEFPVQTDSKGREYFYLSRGLLRDTKTYKEKTYNDRIEDAVSDIMNGYGDAVVNGGIFASNTSNHVIVFLDRKYGEELRSKTIDGWKDAEYFWSVVYRNGLNELYINKDNCAEYDTKDFLHFDTEDEAQKFIDTLMEKLTSDYNEHKSFYFDTSISKEAQKYFEDKTSLEIMLLSDIHNNSISDQTVLNIKPVQLVETA